MYLRVRRGEQRQWSDRLIDPPDDAIFWYRRTDEHRWLSMSAQERRRWIAGQLWNCRDTMPGDLCVELDLPQGSSYATGARQLRRESREAA